MIFKKHLTYSLWGDVTLEETLVWIGGTLPHRKLIAESSALVLNCAEKRCGVRAESMAGQPFTIALQVDEQELLKGLSFDPLSFRGNHEGFLRNAELAHQLTTSLAERKGIPEHRVRYFTDPEYYPGGRGQSRQDSFVRHGNDRDETLRHPHFLKYLRYFIHGADLPAAIIRQYTDAVEDCGMVSSSDIPELGAKARNLARTHRLEGSAAADEFFKLSLDLGLSAGQSARIRESVKQLRPSR